MDTALRYAAPTGQPVAKDSAPTEGRAGPHGEWWTRGLPPFDCLTLNNPTALDCQALSGLPTSDNSLGVAGRNTGGRFASGFQLLEAGTVSIKTAAGIVDAFGGLTLPAGFAFTVEFSLITCSAHVVVTW